MLPLSKIFSPRFTVCHCKDYNKKQVLERISSIVCDTHQAISYQEVLESLQQRERLGSTAIGHGIAIPHGRIQHLNYPICTLISLEKAIEFNSPETTAAVDLIFGLLVPKDASEEHLQILAELVNKLKNKSYREKLRAAETNEALYYAVISDN